MTCQMQLWWVAMQATGHLPFTPIPLAGHLHGRLYVCSVLWYIKSGKPGKSRTALAIDQTSDWSFAIHLLLIQDGRLLN